jgi:hypothetical protein
VIAPSKALLAINRGSMADLTVLSAAKASRNLQNTLLREA